MVAGARQQGSNIHGSQTGRGATRERTWITENYAPLRPSRPGSFTPTFHGQSTLHTQWIRQFRRLQTLAQMHHPNHVPNAKWWANKAKHVLGLPVSLPPQPPDGELTRLLVVDFQKDVRELERMLSAARTTNAKQSRLDDPNRIFRDLQAPHPEPVQMLLAHTVASIAAIDSEECALMLDSANAFQLEQSSICPQCTKATL